MHIVFQPIDGVCVCVSRVWHTMISSSFFSWFLKSLLGISSTHFTGKIYRGYKLQALVANDISIHLSLSDRNSYLNFHLRSGTSRTTLFAFKQSKALQKSNKTWLLLGDKKTYKNSYFYFLFTCLWTTYISKASQWPLAWSNFLAFLMEIVLFTSYD